MAYRLVAIDLDGTIVNREGAVMPGAREAVRRALRAGLGVTLATGRMYQPASRFAQELGISLPLICYQGALIREPASGRVLWHKPLPLPVARRVIEVARAAGVHLYVYLDDQMHVEAIGERDLGYASRNGVVLKLVSDLAAWLTSEPTEMAVRGEPELVDDFSARLGAEFGPGLLVSRIHASFCEVAHPAAGKGNALKHLCGLLGIKPDETVAIGDGPNDVSMLECAGLAIVVGTAAPEVAAQADWVISAEDALAQALDRLIENG
ncbi:MAG: Cof-type HAD-IIB family hydrolase [Pseudomonadota bacterium]